MDLLIGAGALTAVVGHVDVVSTDEKGGIGAFGASLADGRYVQMRSRLACRKLPQWTEGIWPAHEANH